MAYLVDVKRKDKEDVESYPSREGVGQAISALSDAVDELALRVENLETWTKKALPNRDELREMIASIVAEQSPSREDVEQNVAERFDAIKEELPSREEIKELVAEEVAEATKGLEDQLPSLGEGLSARLASVEEQLKEFASRVAEVGRPQSKDLIPSWEEFEELQEQLGLLYRRLNRIERKPAKRPSMFDLQRAYGPRHWKAAAAFYKRAGSLPSTKELMEFKATGELPLDEFEAELEEGPPTS